MNNQSFYLSTVADVTEDERTLDIAYRFYTAPLAEEHGLVAVESFLAYALAV